MHSEKLGLVRNGVETGIKGNKIHEHHFQIEAINICTCMCPFYWGCTFKDV